MHTLLVRVLSILGAVSLFLVVASMCYSRGDRRVTKPSDRQWSIRFFAKSTLVTSAAVLSLVFMARVLADPAGQKLPSPMSIGCPSVIRTKTHACIRCSAPFKLSQLGFRQNLECQNSISIHGSNLCRPRRNDASRPNGVTRRLRIALVEMEPFLDSKCSGSPVASRRRG